jgi:hypothetical protein
VAAHGWFDEVIGGLDDATAVNRGLDRRIDRIKGDRGVWAIGLNDRFFLELPNFWCWCFGIDAGDAVVIFESLWCGGNGILTDVVGGGTGDVAGLGDRLASELVIVAMINC